MQNGGVIGIAAHVDAGKTTLAEAILCKTGVRRQAGRVDDGTAFLDNHPLEKNRGITIFAHQAEFSTENRSYTLLDTPGHVDFSAETERTIRVLDSCILVISGTEGVQSHTVTLWRLLRQFHIPTFLFVNKMDMARFSKEEVLADITQQLGDHCIDFSNGMESMETMESLSLLSEAWMEYFLEHETLPQQRIIEEIQCGNIFPCIFGSARQQKGVTELLALLDAYVPEQRKKQEFGGRVFKISTDEKGNRLTHLKVTGGTLAVRNEMHYTDRKGEHHSEKISQLRIYAGAGFTTREQSETGMVCTVTGLTATYAGQGLGFETDETTPVLEPVLEYAVQLPEGIQPTDAFKKLQRIAEEDPALRLRMHPQTHEICVQLMGEVQLEILENVIAERFNLPVKFVEGKIAYKETIADTVEGIGHYEPLRHYAEVHLLMEPLPQGSGIQVETICPTDILDTNRQRLVLRLVREKQHLGVLTGSPLTDVKITLYSGRDSVKHTEGGDFRQATYRAVRQGLRKTKSVLLEPQYAFTLRIPTECTGRAMTDLDNMKAKLKPLTAPTDGITTLEGVAPVSQMRGYSAEVTNYTRGVGKLLCTPSGYRPCENAEQVIREMAYDVDADIENTADSVFCHGGAGFLVPWYEVEQYMHMPKLEEMQKEKEVLPLRQRTSYSSAPRDTFAEEKELQAIFEKTYGTSYNTRRISDDYEPPKDHTPKAYVAPQVKGENYLFVDGYNMIFAWEELKALAAKQLETARERLIHILIEYVSCRPCKLILVFDAYRVKEGVRNPVEKDGITIVFTAENQTADSYIEKAAHDLSKSNRVRVATSDGMEQMMILGSGAARVPATEFYLEIKNVLEEARKYSRNMEQGKKTITVKGKK